MVEFNRDGTIKGHDLIDSYSAAAEFAVAAEEQGIVGNLREAGTAARNLGKASGLLSAGLTFHEDIHAGMSVPAAAADALTALGAAVAGAELCAPLGPMAAAVCGIGAGLAYDSLRDLDAQVWDGESVAAIDRYLKEKEAQDLKAGDYDKSSYVHARGQVDKLLYQGYTYP